MTLESDLRERLEQRAVAIEVGTVPTSEDMTRRAAQRLRRRRSVTGLAAIVLAALIAVGAGTALRDNDQSTVFAGRDAVLPPPQSVVFTGDGYIGVVDTEPDLFQAPQATTHVFVESQDGEQWTEIAGAPAIQAWSAQVALHDDVVHLAAIRESSDVDAESTRYELLHLETTDLVNIETTTQPFPDTLDSTGTPRLRDLAAADAGVLAVLNFTPNWGDSYQEVLDDLGLETDQVCDTTGTARSLTYRLCGEAEMQTVAVDAPAFDPELRTAVLVAPPGQLFSTVSIPGLEGPGPNVRVYSSGANLGIAGIETFETANGIAWTPVDTGDDVGPMVAIRDEERVFRSAFASGPGNRSGADAVGMAYSNGAQAWTPIDFGDTYDDIDGSLVYFADLQAGPAGWVIIAQRRVTVTSQRSVAGVERTFVGKESDFVLSSDGYQLTGHAPFGPAELTNATGTVVRSWDHLEVVRPEWSGFTIAGQQVQLFEPNASGPLVAFSAEQWTAIAQPYWEEPFEFDLLFSPDGRNWSLLDSWPRPPRVLAVSDSAVVLHRLQATSYAIVASPIETIDLPSAD